ncbi:MAG: WYL domain-containing protein [Burkholderiales bacterium]|nr:WYL domain-containing protein [Burkholderiales bacterium]
MAKRPKTLETVRIAVELLRRIPRSGRIDASTLHRQLAEMGIERNIKSIQVLLNQLSEEFPDIERDTTNKPYGYRWKPGSVGISLPTLSAQEALLLRLAQQQLVHLLPAGLLGSMDGFFSRARAVLGPGTKATLEREWLDKVRVVSTTQPLIPPKIDPEVFEETSRALFGNLLLDLVYRNADGEETTTQVKPLGLAQMGPRLYLVCRFRKYKDNRILALHRSNRPGNPSCDGVISRSGPSDGVIDPGCHAPAVLAAARGRPSSRRTDHAR